MGRQLIKQPNGLYAIWSTVVDAFVLVNATREEVIDYRVNDAIQEARDYAERELAWLDETGKGYGMETFDTAVRALQFVHADEWAETWKPIVDSMGLTK